MGRDGTLDQPRSFSLGRSEMETAVLSDDGCWQPSRKYGSLSAPPGECGEILEQQRLGRADNDVQWQRLGSASLTVRPLFPPP